jgi:hypothetical protein
MSTLLVFRHPSVSINPQHFSLNCSPIEPCRLQNQTPQRPLSNPESPTNPIASSKPIEADEADQIDDEDAGYISDSVSTGSTSITSSIRAHTFEDGIRYHKFHDGKYAFPNDRTEQNRDDMKHAMTLLLCGDRLHFAPIGNNPQNITDLCRNS